MIACSNNGPGNQEAVHDHDSSVQTATRDSSKKSLPAETTKQIGGADIKIAYHAPAVRGRVIWGGLVAYDAVWVTGAHRATSLEASKDFQRLVSRFPFTKLAIIFNSLIPNKLTHRIA